MNFEFTNYIKCSGKINYIPQTNLFITDRFGVCDLKQLQYYGIKHVFNVSLIQLKEYPGISYYNLSISDDPQQNILQFFDKIFSKIDELKQPTVINCKEGISRSASFVIGYLIKRGSSYENSHHIVKLCRPIINPNKGFIEQLKQYEKTVKQTSLS